jgi:uncharacterized protein
VPQQLPFTLVRTDIAGFVGYCERGPLPIAEDFPGGKFEADQVALKITSWKQFLAVFGGFLSYSYLAYAVRSFFENGGDTCYVTRVAALSTRDSRTLPRTAFAKLPAGKAVAIGSIAKAVSSFEAKFTPESGNSPPVPGDPVLLTASSSSQLNYVADVFVDGTLRFTAELQKNLLAGATLEMFPVAAQLYARSRGSWGNRIQVQITPLTSGTFALRTGIYLGPDIPLTEVEFYRKLTLDKDDPNNAVRILNEQSNLLRLTITDEDNAGRIDLTTHSQFRAGRFLLSGGTDQLMQVKVEDFVGGGDDRWGLQLFSEIDEISAIAVPDAVHARKQLRPPPLPPSDPCRKKQPPPVPISAADEPSLLKPEETQRVQQAMIDHCQRMRYRVALIDPTLDPETKDDISIESVQDQATKLQSRYSHYAALYYPWLKVSDPLSDTGSSRRIPPSGAVAGAYARNDLDPTRGVQHPPANLGLEGVSDVVQAISDAQQGDLNQKYVNAIRHFPGRGILVWGARSLANTDREDWRFIHVRRLMSAVEETLERYSRWTVFKNNDIALRASLKHSLEVMLQGIWAKGGLKGGKPEQAFYVKCDATNNPQPVIDRGQLICEVGIAVAEPMEFLVFEIRQSATGGTVVEN